LANNPSNKKRSQGCCRTPAICRVVTREAMGQGLDSTEACCFLLPLRTLIPAPRPPHRPASGPPS
jgi:hypothetical protein